MIGYCLNKCDDFAISIKHLFMRFITTITYHTSLFSNAEHLFWFGKCFCRAQSWLTSPPKDFFIIIIDKFVLVSLPQ